MLSLIELAKEGNLEKTGAKPKLPIKVDGVSSETLDVYKIPLEYLFRDYSFPQTNKIWAL